MAKAAVNGRWRGALVVALVGVVASGCTSSPSGASEGGTASASPSATVTSSSTPTTSKSASDKPVPDRDVRKVDWKNATITLPPSTHKGSWEGFCPTGTTVRFRDGYAKGREEGRIQVFGTLGNIRPRPVYGDLTGDGTAEAIAYFNCSIGDTADSCEGVAVVGARGNNLVVLDYAYAPPSADREVKYNCALIPVAYRISNRRLAVDMAGAGDGAGSVVVTWTFRWNGSHLQVA